MSNSKARSVVIVTTGGTIASRPDPSGGVVAVATGDELLAAVPELKQIANVRVEELFRIGSYLLQPEDLLKIAQRVRSLAADADVDGIVVTHGTDTMEESTYLVDLLYNGDKPVVFTGAQRNAAMPDSDGPRNLRDAVRIAASPAARHSGAVIAVGGRIDGARNVTKVHTSALRAFGSLNHGQLGEVTEDKVHIFYSRRRPSNLNRIDTLIPHVSLVKLVVGTDGAFLRAARESGAKGIVIEAFGLGNANHEVLAEVKRAIGSGIAVVVVSRCLEGIVEPVYGNAGGYDLAQAGAIFGGNLSGQKARILLMAALAAAEQLKQPVDDLLRPHLIL